MTEPVVTEASGDDANRQALAAMPNWEELFELSPCGNLIMSADGVIVRANKTFLTMTGYASHELIGKRKFSELLTIGGRLYHETHVAPMLRLQGRTDTIAFEVICANDARLPVFVTSSLDLDEDDNPTVIRCAVLSAHERRGYEEELLRAKQLANVAEANATALAHTLQQSLIPPAIPAIPGLDVGAVYRPQGNTVGGDFYDVFKVGTREWVISIGDVSGKGPGAAVVTSLVRHTIRAAMVEDPRPSHALHMANEVLIQDHTSHFCTVAIISFRQRKVGWHITTSCAGHPLPLLNRADTVTELGTPGPLLGFFEGEKYEDIEFDLEDNDAIVLYTDGVTESRLNGAFYGEESLKAIFSRKFTNAQEISNEIVADAMRFQDDIAHDDIAVVAIRVVKSKNPEDARV